MNLHNEKILEPRTFAKFWPMKNVKSNRSTLLLKFLKSWIEILQLDKLSLDVRYKLA